MPTYFPPTLYVWNGHKNFWCRMKLALWNSDMWVLRCDQISKCYQSHNCAFCVWNSNLAHSVLYQATAWDSFCIFEMSYRERGWARRGKLEVCWYDCWWNITGLQGGGDNIHGHLSSYRHWFLSGSLGTESYSDRNLSYYSDWLQCSQ